MLQGEVRVVICMRSIAVTARIGINVAFAGLLACAGLEPQQVYPSGSMNSMG
jgi:hypothetical protein